MADTVAKFDPDELTARLHKPIIIGLVLFVLTALSISDLPPYIHGMQAFNWSKTNGTLKEVNIEPYKVGTASGFENSLSYMYMVGSQVYFGKRIKFQEKRVYTGMETADFGKKFAVGNSIPVLYNPDDPKLCCLEPGASIVRVFNQMVIYLMLSLIIYLSIYPRLTPVKQPKPAKSQDK